ncbi:hypothetical protein PIB30_078169 [Stylosanthes scabra]|uniref:Uncharacterized protein n=1 Tax=Stylosanthes scabra TaxID=79078 RepID=A0ABU6SS09_9FABA|nr:hypothetical protein [Stylosanthes scabra]
MARAPDQDPPRNHPLGDRHIVMDRRMTCRARLCSLTLTNPSRVRGFSTTSPCSNHTFTHHRSSISYPRPIASRTTNHHCSSPISHLHGLSNIISPPSAITHRRPSHNCIRVRHRLHMPLQHDNPAHQIVRPRAQQPQRDRHPPPCDTSSYLYHRPAHGGDRD